MKFIYDFIEYLYFKLPNNLAFTDQLTKINNRNYLERIRSKYDRKSCFVHILDADGLKHVNDTYGHDTGDKFLIDIVKAVEDLSGILEFIRYGGDEFLVIANRDLSGELPPVVSVGVKYKFQCELLSTAMKCADKSMYVQKNEKKLKKLE